MSVFSKKYFKCVSGNYFLYKVAFDPKVNFGLGRTDTGHSVAGKRHRKIKLLWIKVFVNLYSFWELNIFLVIMI
jgi:hypothetical protein